MPPANDLPSASLALAVGLCLISLFLGLRQWYERKAREPDLSEADRVHFSRQDSAEEPRRGRALRHRDPRGRGLQHVAAGFRAGELLFAPDLGRRARPRRRLAHPGPGRLVGDPWLCPTAPQGDSSANPSRPSVARPGRPTGSAARERRGTSRPGGSMTDGSDVLVPPDSSASPACPAQPPQPAYPRQS